jgi:Flp pilus assembly protein TadG
LHRRKAADRRGAALLEFALLLSLLLILLFGIIDFGRVLFTANNLTAAAREGARYAAVLNDPMGNEAAIQQRVASHMSPFGSAPVNPSQVQVTFNSTAGALQSITVQVNYPFNWLTPFRQLVGGTLADTLHAQARFRWEQAQ